MLRPAPTETARKRPDPGSLFTDRERERDVLETALAPTPTAHPELFLTVLYGVGGTGKSALGAQARRIAAGYKSVTLVNVDFDTSAWTIDSPFVAIAGVLAQALERQGIPVPLSVLLLALHSFYSKTRSESVGKRVQDVGLEFLSEAAELWKEIPLVSPVLKAGKIAWDAEQLRKSRSRAQELGLWPVEHSGRVDLIDLESKINLAMLEDIRTFLAKHKKRHVRVLVDGFDRLQSYDRRVDAQMRLQELLRYCAASPDRPNLARIRVIVLSREKLRWDALFDRDWEMHCQQHLLNGLAEADAREYLGRWQAWFSANSQQVVAGMLAASEKDILKASLESTVVAPAFSPFYLTLAVELAERSVIEGVVPDFGETSAELQDRFFRYLKGPECRALMVLSLAGVFDRVLFDWLAEQRVIEFAAHSFDTALRQEHCYFQSAGGETWRFHRLFQMALRSRWNVDDSSRRECGAVIRRLLDFYATSLLRIPERDWTDKEVHDWSAGMEVLTAEGLEAKLLSIEDWSDLASIAPWSSHSHRCATARLRILPRVLRERESRQGTEHPDTLHSAEELALLLQASGDLPAAEPLYRRVLDVRERILGAEHPLTLGSVNNLGFFLHAKGELAAAERLYRRALDGYEHVMGAEDPETIRIANNLASLLASKGDLRTAESQYHRVLRAWEKQKGPQDPDTLTAANNLALVLQAKGEIAAAETIFRLVLVRRERVLGLEHPDTLGSVNNLGYCLSAKGELEAAERLHRRALNGYERVLGSEHSDSLRSVSNLAAVLQARGYRPAAERLHRRALKGRERSLGSEHPDTFQSLNNLATLLLAKGELADAEPLLRRALEGRGRILGSEHPETLDSVVNLAALLHAKGDLSGAESQFRRALDAYDRMLGSDHSSTLTATGNLAVVLQAKGDLMAAKILLDRTLSSRERVLGAEHPDTIGSLNNLAYFYETIGRLATAEPLYRRAVESSERVLGANHPDSLGIANNLRRLLNKRR